MSPAPVVPRPAATVLLLRDHPHPVPGRSPLQVFLQRRVTGMAFAAGMTVFPGGGVDAGDRPDPDHWAGPGPGWWAGRLGVDPDLAGAFVQAAVRETFEECGVLLAGPGVPPDVRRHRADVVARRRTFTDVLAANGLVLRADLLHAWARWITPVGSPRRYDTAFFVARVPAGQEADAHTTEAVDAQWWNPDEALERWQEDEMQLMAPTARTLQEIAGFAESSAVLAAAGHRVIRPITPTVRCEGGRLVSVLPDDTTIPADGFQGRPA
ncbi:NUDIX hydrolase [Pseudonocardia zijingensis]|jgi:8-oxo-dGTP pyrophosphatase MutT (NUDIX family)|uniref:NUDIX domain-containing protein n=1 Tax=Pseudonocardia zijingensis TaxID=153376 RepID=A0ABP3YUY4_9PSEU